MRKRRLIVRMIVVVALSLIIALIWATIHGFGVQSYRLPDGSTVTLIGSDYGKQHRLFGHGSLWWERLLPPHQIASMQTPDDVLVLWLYHPQPLPPPNRQQTPTSTFTYSVNGRLIGGGSNSPWWDYYSVQDELGHTLTSSYGSLHNDLFDLQMDQTAYFWNGPPSYEHILIPFFPRRGNKVIIKLYRNRDPVPLASFTLDNPNPGPYPTWMPAKPPITKRDGDLAFTLADLYITPSFMRHTGINNSFVPINTLAQNGMQPDDILGSTAEFRVTKLVKPDRAWDNVTKQGRPTDDWTNSSFSIQDATGNRSDANRFVAGVISGDATVRRAVGFDDLYCTGDSVVKIHAGFQRTNRAEFRPNETWGIANLPLPAPNKLTLLNATTDREGIHLQALGISGGGIVQFGNQPIDQVSSDTPFIRLKLTPQTAPLHVMLRVMDQQGRMALEAVRDPTPNLQGWIESTEGELVEGIVTQHIGANNSTGYQSDSHPYRILTFFFKPQPGAKKLNLTFAIEKPKEFDFITDLNAQNQKSVSQDAPQ